jgi:hypothetical protein
MEHYSAKKKNGIMSFFRKMDGTGDHHIKWNKLGSERQILHFLSYVEYEYKCGNVWGRTRGRG